MQYVLKLLQLVGGLGLFLYGMRVMSDAIQKRAGSRLKRWMDRMTYNRFLAAFAGLFITCVIQSSSATTVLLVSFVNAGLVSLSNSIGVVMGANIGTTLTAWMVSFFGFKFSIATIALPAIALALPMIFSKTEKRRDSGYILVGFGLLFLGLSFMKDNVPDIKNNPEVMEFVKHLAGKGMLSTLIFVILGSFLTIVVQSSSAAMAITLVMATKGWIDFRTAAAIVMGENIGTTITAYLASLGLGVEAKRTARAHMLFNLIGVVWLLLFFGPFVSMVENLIPEGKVMVPSAQVEGVETAETTMTPDAERDAPEPAQKPSTTFADEGERALTGEEQRVENLKKLSKWRLSLFHTMFNLINTFVLIGFVPVIARVVTRWVKEPRADLSGEYRVRGISARLPDALESNLIVARTEIGKMALAVHDMFEQTMAGADVSRDNLPEHLARLKRIEESTDEMQKKISAFLTGCMMIGMTEGQARAVSAKERIIDELESIADSAYSITLLFDRKARKTLHFHEKGIDELQSFTELVLRFLKYNSDFLVGTKIEDGFKLERAQEMEDAINAVRNKLRKETRKALSAGGDVRGEMVFIDIVRHLEHIGDYCLNISQASRDLS